MLKQILIKLSTHTTGSQSERIVEQSLVVFLYNAVGTLCFILIFFLDLKILLQVPILSLSFFSICKQ